MEEGRERAETSRYNTVVIGAGPIGLLSALCALKECEDSDEKVAIVADRIDELGMRQQVLWIEEDVFQFMQNIVGSELMQEYIANLALTEATGGAGYYITTGDLERLFYDALREYERGVQYDLIQSEKIRPGKAVSDSIQIDLDESTISLQGLSCNDACYSSDNSAQTVTLSFKHLVAADGAKRSIVNALGTDTVAFEATQEPLHHTKHVVAVFQLPAETTPEMCYRQKDIAKLMHEEEVASVSSLRELKEDYGWEGHIRPYSQIYSTKDVVYIGAEMPPQLPREKAREYARTLMRDSMPDEYVSAVSDISCDMGTAFGKKQKQLSVSIFDIELGDINRTVLPCGHMTSEEDTSVIFFMGDARKNPLYTTGTGVQTGIREVLSFNTFLESESEASTLTSSGSDSSLEDRIGRYHADTRRVLDNITEVQNNWISGRNQKEGEAKENCDLFKQHKAEILALDEYIGRVNGMLTSMEGRNPPQFIQDICTNLREMESDYIAIFSHAHYEEDLFSYQEIRVQEMLEALAEIHQDILAQYPNEEALFTALPDPNTRRQVTGAYNDFKSLSENLLGLTEKRSISQRFQDVVVSIRSDDGASTPRKGPDSTGN
ncbi:MAG: hypothetical protein K0U37_09010 [Gammaproteobacteria bacterium]|nr:hypothetical protein [Gammaproteobacteria bacterium]